MKLINQTKPWQVLRDHHHEITQQSMPQWFAADAMRVERFTLQHETLSLDLSKNLATEQTLSLLADLARQVELPARVADLSSGCKVNVSEQQPALHTALRNLSDESVLVDGQDVMPMIKAQWVKMQQFCDAVHRGQHCGFAGEPIAHILHLGVGGSELGPAFLQEALQDYTSDISCDFIGNYEPHHLQTLLAKLDPAKTLVIVVSKSMRTQEALLNAEKIKQWLSDAAGSEQKILPQMVAITANAPQALQQGFLQENIFSIWQWVGGRFSLWSAVSLSVAILIGWENFTALLKGANAMDRHFQTAPILQNMPMMLALLGVWYCNFFNAGTQAIISYQQSMKRLLPHLQQLHMESLGKNVTQAGEQVDYATGAIIWGGIGTSSQHTFFQLLQQGTHRVPVDFILPLQDNDEFMIANCLAQSEALMHGSGGVGVKPWQVISGNKPSNTITLNKITPHALGQLLALYEHKVYAQSVIWNINAFDQWGVECGKEQTQKMLAKIHAPNINSV